MTRSASTPRRFTGSVLAQSIARPQRQIAGPDIIVMRQVIGKAAGEGEAIRVGRRKGQSIADISEGHQRIEQMIAVAAPPGHMQCQIDLRGGEFKNRAAVRRVRH